MFFLFGFGGGAGGGGAGGAGGGRGFAFSPETQPFSLVAGVAAARKEEGEERVVNHVSIYVYLVYITEEVHITRTPLFKLLTLWRCCLPGGNDKSERTERQHERPFPSRREREDAVEGELMVEGKRLES